MICPQIVSNNLGAFFMSVKIYLKNSPEQP